VKRQQEGVRPKGEQARSRTLFGLDVSAEDPDWEILDY
jgi:hypothetical protein